MCSQYHKRYSWWWQLQACLRRHRQLQAFPSRHTCQQHYSGNGQHAGRCGTRSVQNVHVDAHRIKVSMQRVVFCAVNITEGILGGGSCELAYVTIDSHKRFPKGRSRSAVTKWTACGTMWSKKPIERSSRCTLHQMSMQTMLFCAVNITGGILGGGSYEPTHVTIDSHKRFPKGASVSSILQEIDSLHLDVEHEAYRTSKSMHTPPMPPAGNVEEEVPQLTVSRRKAGEGHAEQLADGEGKYVGIKCSNTCNGKPMTWGGWWPCWCVPPSVCTSTCLPLPGTLPKQPFWIVCFLTFWPLLRILIKQYNSSV
jgi:hypothetical protein